MNTFDEIYQYNSIENFEYKVIKVDISTELQISISDATNPNAQRKFVFDYILQNLRGKYNTTDGREVVISSKTAKKYTNKADELKLRVAPYLDEMLMNAKLINIVYAEHASFEKFAYYETFFENNGKSYVGLLNVGITIENESILYDLRPIKEK